MAGSRRTNVSEKPPGRAGRVALALLFIALLAAVGGCASSTAAQDPAAAERQRRIEAMRVAKRPIAAGESYWLEELTSLEIRDRIAGGASVAIIPTGGIEENGPFLSTGKHNLILASLCPELARHLGNALCAPVVKFVPEGSIDPPSGAMHFPGSISLRAETYEALLDDIASSLRQAGFIDIVMIGDSGGNQAGMEAVARTLNERWAGTDVRAHFVREFYDPGWVDTERYTETELGVAETQHDGHHDDIWVTAMMMVTDPEQVRYRQRVEAGLASINGVAITPLEETVDLGRKMIEFRASYTADAIRRSIGDRQ